MITIREEDFIRSIADGLQFISYYHPADYIRHLTKAYEIEESTAAKDAIAQILVNSRMAAIGKRPICQDTGMVSAFIKVGMNVRFETHRSLAELVNEGVRRGYRDSANPLRASMVVDPLFNRANTRDNSPAVVYAELVPGDVVDITLCAKGGGSENKARFVTLNPSDSVADWVVNTVSSLGAGWCPPGMIGIGIGGSSDKAMHLAKEALLEPIDMTELLARGPAIPEEEMRIDLYQRINALGIGAQGLGGLTTVVDVKIKSFPTHAASMPVGLVPQCAANRHIEFTLDGSGPAHFDPPDLEDWPKIALDRTASMARKVDLDRITQDEIATWKPGETLLLSGRLLTGRDAAHKRLTDLIKARKPLPVDLKGRFIYYVGPVDPVGDEVVGPAGPTTSTRMDKFTDLLLGETGLLGMVGKAERGPEAIAAIKRHRAVYTVAVGGAAYLVAKAIKSSKLVAFADLGMEAIYEFVVEDMPVTVAVDVNGDSIHELGRMRWRKSDT
ncbi:fumarate hydratase [Agrobacterium tumefaciens]|uniref:fumarate hydratase n=1 Tax=Agrobacterium tumefaciens TaxID=358 RepID=UPI001572615B|nr:fumarate hydratase [Agrobacterium tumefaciens]NTB96044.1 fumarate hydratase [Agrobacterium tumefaciens]NTC42975.1 fumarate hydratase [Agrobacterium tumefaciens]